jgi:MYXO-CTERM domain-containing protein
MTRALFSLIGAALLASAVAPASAEACGGFFCDNSQPVNQQAERIIFARGEDGSVTAVIEILYDGPSERFAWLLPVDGVPEVAVSSGQAFQALQLATNPQYRLTTTTEGQCMDFAFRGPPIAFAGDEGFGGPDAGASAADAGATVTVLDSGSVGPYDYATISVADGVEDPAEEARLWLEEEGYDVAELGTDRLGEYLARGNNLIAFRLTKGATSGAIRPIRLAFGSGQPIIPLRPTAVAAEDDMGIMVFMLGDSRAIPVNYASLELNESLIDWLNPGRNYEDVVAQAANEGGGQGFVTEYAGTSDVARQSIWADFMEDRWTPFADASTWEGHHGLRLNALYRSYINLDGAREVLLEEVPRSGEVSDDEFLARFWLFVPERTETVEGLDVETLLARFEDEVIGPMRDTAALFDAHPYLTRLYTTMDAEEMTVDPAFDFNPDLPDVSNVHEAERVIECSPSVSLADAPWRVTFEDGTVLRGSGNTWPLDLTPETPAAEVIRRVGTSGVGEIQTDNTDVAADIIETNNLRFPPPSDGGGLVDGCSVGGGGASSTSLALFAALALVGLRRRRADLS